VVEARPDERDGRVVRFGLSALGRTRVASVIANKDNAYMGRRQGWSDEDLVTLTDLLRRLVNDRADAGPASLHR
jgi:DNA-binding MarR family transcriptional regulator